MYVISVRFFAAAVLIVPVCASAQVAYNFTGVATGGSAASVGSPITGSITINFAAANPTLTQGTIGSTGASWIAQAYGGSTSTLPTPSAFVFSSTINSAGFSYTSTPLNIGSWTDVQAGWPSQATWQGDEVEYTDRLFGCSYVHNYITLTGGAGIYPWDSNGLPVFGNASLATGAIFGDAGCNGNYILQYTITSLTSASGSSDSGNTTDGPIPFWALGALGAGLLGIAARRKKVQ